MKSTVQKSHLTTLFRARRWIHGGLDEGDYLIGVLLLVANKVSVVTDAVVIPFPQNLAVRSMGR